MKQRTRLTTKLATSFILVALVGVMHTPHRAFADPVGDAQATTDSLISALLAAVLDVTFATENDPNSIATNSAVISLLLPHGRGAYRLLDGTGEPINPRNQPRGRFERDALEEALSGNTTQIVRGNKLLTVVPLPFAAANCALCHTNYLNLLPGDNVGAISLRVPLLDN